MRGALDSSFAIKAIADAVEERIRSEIEAVLRERVEPLIEEISVNAAKEICKGSMVAVQRDLVSYGGFKVLIKFGERVAFEQDLRS